jgi:hypothetical protein
MTRSFSRATAEQVIGVVESIVQNGKPSDIDFVEKFCDQPHETAKSALELAIDLGFLRENNGKFEKANYFCDLLVSPSETQKAAILRIQLESYEPFVMYRKLLKVNQRAITAAKQTVTILDLAEHHEAVNETLISLGTYSHALTTGGAGIYHSTEESLENPLVSIVKGCENIASAKNKIRDDLGNSIPSRLSDEIIINPLSEALIKCTQNDPRGAVLFAGNSIESFLDHYGTLVGVALINKTGINAKIDELSRLQKLPKKLANVGKYLGHIRNAADHGNDPEISMPWTITNRTGLEYVSVAISFIVSCMTYQNERRAII